MIRRVICIDSPLEYGLWRAAAYVSIRVPEKKVLRCGQKA